MRTLGQLSPMAAPLALAVSLVFFPGNLRAFGPGGAGNVGNANGAGNVGGAVVGGGARAGVSTGANVSGPSISSGARNGVSISNSAARPGVSSQGAGIRGNAPAGLSVPYRNVLNGPSPFVGARSTAPQSVTRPGNSWSGTAVNTTGTGTGRSLYSSNGYTSNRFTGQHLYPGTNGSNLPTTNGWTDRGRGNDGTRNGHSPFRGSGRYDYYPYAYGPAYAPYIGYYGGGYPAYAGAYPYSNDLVTNDIDSGPATATVSPQYRDQSPDADNAQPDPARQQQPDAATQNPNGNTAARGTVPDNGPDSLVEAVQQELVRRGYFGGKVDAMFNADTKDALRKFQADHHLAETGLINEATLHALQLD